MATAIKILRYITKSIETLRPGDCVLARDESDPNGELVLRQVEEVFERTAYRLQIITLRSSNGIEQTLKTTAEHPVYALNQGWIVAGKLRPGDTIAEPNDGIATVVALKSERHSQGIAVYNLRVQNAHTYFVRAEGSQAEPVWVHNECNTPLEDLEMQEHHERMQQFYGDNAGPIKDLPTEYHTELHENIADAIDDEFAGEGAPSGYNGGQKPWQLYFKRNPDAFTRADAVIRETTEAFYKEYEL